MTRYRKLSGSQLTRGTRIRFMRRVLIFCKRARCFITLKRAVRVPANQSFQSSSISEKAPVCQPSPLKLMHSQPKNMWPGPVSRPGIFLRNAEIFVRYISFERYFLAALYSGQVAAKFLTVLAAVSDCICHAVDTNRNAINPCILNSLCECLAGESDEAQSQATGHRPVYVRKS